MKGRHRRSAPVGFAAVLTSLVIVAAAAVVVRALADHSPIEPNANAALSKAPEGRAREGPPPRLPVPRPRSSPGGAGS